MLSVSIDSSLKGRNSCEAYLQHIKNNTTVLLVAHGCCVPWPYTTNMPLLDSLIAVAAPHYCLVCGVEGFLLCGYCQHDLSVVPSRCYRCQASTTDSKVCTSCRRQSSLKHVWVRTSYQDTSQRLLHMYKFERAQSAYKTIASSMGEVLPVIPKDTLVVPVPTATVRQRLRGYDHALLLAKEIAKQRGLIYTKPVTRLSQARQVGASRKQRFKQLEQAIMVAKPGAVENQNILLVDDVTTTGATLEAVASALKRAGAKQVDALVFAQKL